VGINNRNLRTFEVTLDTTLAMLPTRAGRIACWSPSRASWSPADVQRMRDADVHAFLVGEAFMRGGILHGQAPSCFTKRTELSL
jgi:indole-3-glycerol phosphate synthase